MQVESLDIYSDSQLVVCQVTNEYQVRGEKMASYLQKAKDLLSEFSLFKIQQIPREQNTQADALARLASTKDSELLEVIPVEFLSTLSITPTNPQSTINSVTSADTCITPIIQYLKDDYLPEDKKKARLLRLKATKYILYDEQLYRRGFSTSLLKCIDLTEGNYILQEIHEMVCGNHAGGQSLAHKVLQQGYFWLTLRTDAMAFARKCDKCQRFSNIPRSHPKKLTSMTWPWPFAIWGIDLIGPLPTVRPAFKYVVVAVDYLTKWVEAKTLATISGKKVQNFV